MVYSKRGVTNTLEIVRCKWCPFMCPFRLTCRKLRFGGEGYCNCEIKKEKPPKKPWHYDKGLMEFLKTL